MPVAGQRNEEETRATLTSWLAGKLGHADDVQVTELVVPQSSGFSNETFLFDASWSTADGHETGEFVLRAQPQGYGLFPHIDVLAQQYQTMKRVGEVSDVPVPTMRWAEADMSVLGSPFFVMDKIEGDVPPDSPPYVVEGMIIDLPVEQRRELCENGIAAMAQVNTIDWRSVGGFEHLDRKQHGPLGPEQLRNYFLHYHDWALKGRAHPVLDPAKQWLVDNWPDDGQHLELTWGDARMGNQMFQGTECVGVFDWEMSAITNAESDIGWWLYMQRFHCAGSEVDLPEGLLDVDEAVAFWESKVGRSAEHVDFYLALGGYHFSLIMVAMADCMQELAPGAFPDDFYINNPGPMVLADILGL